MISWSAREGRSHSQSVYDIGMTFAEIISLWPSRPALRLPESLEEKIRVLGGQRITPGEYLRDLIIETVEGDERTTP